MNRLLQCFFARMVACVGVVFGLLGTDLCRATPVVEIDPVGYFYIFDANSHGQLVGYSGVGSGGAALFDHGTLKMLPGGQVATSINETGAIVGMGPNGFRAWMSDGYVDLLAPEIHLTFKPFPELQPSAVGDSYIYGNFKEVVWPNLISGQISDDGSVRANYDISATWDGLWYRDGVYTGSSWGYWERYNVNIQWQLLDNIDSGASLLGRQCLDDCYNFGVGADVPLPGQGLVGLNFYDYMSDVDYNSGWRFSDDRKFLTAGGVVYGQIYNSITHQDGIYSINVLEVPEPESSWLLISAGFVFLLVRSVPKFQPFRH